MLDLFFILHFTYFGNAHAPNAAPCLWAWFIIIFVHFLFENMITCPPLVNGILLNVANCCAIDLLM